MHTLLEWSLPASPHKPQQLWAVTASETVSARIGRAGFWKKIKVAEWLAKQNVCWGHAEKEVPAMLTRYSYLADWILEIHALLRLLHDPDYLQQSGKDWL